MADTVQYRLERMTDELDDLERRGLFTRREIAEVVRRRRDFEFRLRRHSPRRADFLDYVAYELSLDALRALRKRAILRAAADEDDDDGEEDEEGGEKKKKKRKRAKKWKKSISDVAGVLRVLDIYRMATIRFKGDLDLWFRYLEFCRDKRHGRMKQWERQRSVGEYLRSEKKAFALAKGTSQVDSSSRQCWHLWSHISWMQGRQLAAAELGQTIWSCKGATGYAWCGD